MSEIKHVASYSPGEYNVIGMLKSTLDAKKKLLVSQVQEQDRIARAMQSTQAHIAEIENAIARLEVSP